VEIDWDLEVREENREEEEHLSQVGTGEQLEVRLNVFL
jgi:hypothetical protein